MVSIYLFNMLDCDEFCRTKRDTGKSVFTGDSHMENFRIISCAFLGLIGTIIAFRGLFFGGGFFIGMTFLFLAFYWGLS